MKKLTGFTLVEVVVTLMIIITLSLLSFPIYKGRTHKTSMLAEGYTLLGTVLDAQVSYFNEYGYFLSPWVYRSGMNWTTNDEILGVNCINNRYFTNFCFGNPNYNGGAANLYYYKYTVTAIVKSAKAGPISLVYNLTQRFEPEVSGV